jgi:hypothetical protein
MISLALSPGWEITYSKVELHLIVVRPPREALHYLKSAIANMLS